MNKDIMRKAGFEKEVALVESFICPTCCKDILLLNAFKDELSYREYRISGMCQQCQDEVFGEGEPDE